MIYSIIASFLQGGVVLKEIMLSLLWKKNPPILQIGGLFRFLPKIFIFC